MADATTILGRKLSYKLGPKSVPSVGQVIRWSGRQWEPWTPGGGAPEEHAASHAYGESDAVSPASIGAAAASHAHAPGDVTGTAVVTSDARLSDARTPTAHGSAEHAGTIGTPASVGLPAITVSTTAPGSPAVGDLWVDTN